MNPIFVRDEVRKKLEVMENIPELAEPVSWIKAYIDYLESLIAEINKKTSSIADELKK